MKQTNKLRSSSSLLALVGALSWSHGASAHIRMSEPVARNVWATTDDGKPDPGADPIKQGPCGSGANDPRTTDPAKINTFAPGETITVSWEETIAHPSHYRISIDMDGQDDFVDVKNSQDIEDPPVLPVLLDGIPDKSNGKDSFSVQVTLPNQTCDNCTLQLIQFMYDRMTSYYICADLIIADDVASGDGSGGSDSMGIASGGGSAEPSGSGGSDALGSGGASDESGRGTGGAALSSGGQSDTSDITSSSGGESNSTTSDTSGSMEADYSDAQKNCSVVGSVGIPARAPAVAWFSLAGLLALTYRRRSAPRS